MSDRLRNLGPKSVQMLATAGIGLDMLREMGSVQAYLRIRAVWPRASLNLLWALEGAICDEPWQQVARNKRLSLLLQLEEAQRRQ